MARSLLRLAPFLLAVAALAWPLAAAQRGDAEPDPAAHAPPAVTVVCFRHAEKADDDPRDPTLSEAGRARAAALGRLLGAADATHLYSTDYRRTRETLAPLAEATGLAVASYDPRDLDAFAAELVALPPGSVALVAGHSNTTPQLALALGAEVPELVDGRAGPTFDDAAYDRVLVLTLVPGEGGATLAAQLELRSPAR